jgi:site-specific recombinase XerD
MNAMKIPPVSKSDEFIRDRQWFKNVTQKTLDWYAQAFKSFAGCETENDYKVRIAELRQRGVSAVSVNSWTRCINAYAKWAGLGWRLPRLKEESKILPTLDEGQISTLRHARTQGVVERRTWVSTMLLLDCGLRVSEMLGIRYEDVNLDQAMVLIRGKGRKERRVPISSEMRRILHRYMRPDASAHDFVFGTRNGTRVSVRNFERDLDDLAERLHIPGVSPHGLRRTFACAYLKSGGNLEYLRRILGHASITTTQKYLQGLGVADLGAVHSDFSPISPQATKWGDRRKH